MAALRWRPAPLTALSLGTIGFVGAYGVVLETAFYPWYVALPVFLLAWLAGCGAERLIVARRTRAGRGVLVGALMTTAVAAATLTPSMLPVRRQQVEVGRWLSANTPASATVASAELGRIGAISERTMVDYLGLLDAAAVPHLERADWTWWVDELRPDYWVADRNPDFTPDAQVRTSAALERAYVPVMTTEHVVVYQRRR